MNVEPVEGQGAASNPRVESLVESKRRRRRPPRPSHPRVDLVVESQRRVYDSFSNHCKERTSGSHSPLPLVRLGQPSGRSQAVGTDQAEGVRDGLGGGGEPRGHETVPGEGGAY